MCENDLAIKVQNIGKKYILNQPIVDNDGNNTKEFWALENITFEIKKGESVGIIGTNGSGKSTLLKILAGVTKPSCGNATIKGRVASILDIGAGFHPELSGKENIFLNGQLLGFTKKEIAVEFDKIVDFSEIGKFINQPVKNYSSGMYLRLAFSIMANLHFDIYLLDEVMNVGDTNFQLKVKQFIKHKKNNTATFIFVSHDLNTLISNCEKFYLLDSGKIINNGKADVIENYLYNSLLKSNSSFPINKHVTNKNPLLKNDYLILKEIKVDTNHNDSIIEDKPIEFSCLIETIKPFKIDIAFGIENLLGNDICYVSTLISNVESEDKTCQNEHILISAILPPYTIKKGVYILKLNIIMNETNPLISQFKALQNKIKKSNKLNSEMIDQRPNTAIIHSEWTFKRHL
mgnify:FL=1